jgi:hypothetical protein
MTLHCVTAWIFGPICLALAALAASGCEAFRRPRPQVEAGPDVALPAVARRPDASPHEELPVALVDPQTFVAFPAAGLRITWFGHSSMLLEIVATGMK